MNSDFETSQSSCDYTMKRKTLQRGKENQSVNRNSTIYSSITQVIEKSHSYQHMKLSNGGYYGQVQKGKAHGVGSCMFKSGSFYYGEWRNNCMHGFGIYFFEVGGYLRGEFVNGKADGQLELCYQNGAMVQGWFKEGRQHGSGIKVSRRGKEQVNYRFGVRVNTEEAYTPLDFNQVLKNHLPCMYIHADRVVYGLQCDLSGLGAIYYMNSRMDLGWFSNGSLNGKGRIIFKSGDIYDGGLRNGQFSGEGRYLNYQSKQVTDGMFENNQILSIRIQETLNPHPIEYQAVDERVHIKNLHLKTRTGNVDRSTTLIRNQSSDRHSTSTKVNKIQNLISHMLKPGKVRNYQFSRSELTPQEAMIDQLLSRVQSPKGRQNLEQMISQVTSPIR